MARPCPAPLPPPRSGMPRANQRRCGRGDASPVPAAGVAGAAGTPNCWFFARHPSGLAGNVLKFSFFFSFSPLFPSSCWGGALPAVPGAAAEGLEIGAAPQIPSPLPRCASAFSSQPETGRFWGFFPPAPSPRMALQKSWGAEGGVCSVQGGLRASPARGERQTQSHRTSVSPDPELLLQLSACRAGLQRA